MRCPLLFSGSPPLAVAAAGIVAASLLFLAPNHARGQDGFLQTMRDDVRDGPPPSSPSPNSPSPKKDSSNDVANDLLSSLFGGGDGDGSAFVAVLAGAGVVVGSPIWVPMALIDNHFFQMDYLPRYPYKESLADLIDPAPRFWTLRFDTEYADSFDHLESFGGHLLLETASRFGLEAAASQFEEQLSGNRRDRLCLGDANLVYRFAQSDFAEFRTGLGVNWLADQEDADFGFNFIYAADFFPCKPWVFSSVLDCGTLGRTGLFRFRTTAGVVFHGIEAYVGYEYLDVGRAATNSLVSGLRFWF